MVCVFVFVCNKIRFSCDEKTFDKEKILRIKYLNKRETVALNSSPVLCAPVFFSER